MTEKGDGEQAKRLGLTNEEWLELADLFAAWSFLLPPEIAAEADEEEADGWSG